ncbi:MAG: protein-glutamate O-methyltransferase CheR [Armatimonadota bacterium]|nr:protein-glutamate O-methyltransferase CheR [Armatimonadota bacterium]
MPERPKLPLPSENFSEADFTWFQQRVESQTGIRLSQYKPDQMRRRIAALADKAGSVSFAAYASVIERDPARLAEFLDRMTINVTELLRNPNRFEEMVSTILPDLLVRRKGGPLSVWSAGCSYGAEAYTLALLLHEINPISMHQVYGTDIDLTVLAKAARPSFSAADMVNICPARRAAHFQENGGVFHPKTHLCAKVRFEPHDLLAGSYPDARYDLILCRNVVIYFTDDAKERIYRGFFRALRPGGILFVGGTERLADHRALGFELIRPFFYRKP